MINEMKSRAGWQTDATRDASGSTSSLPPVPVAGRVRLDVTRLDGRINDDDELCNAEMTRQFKCATVAPAGVEIVIVVRAGQYYPGEGVAYLRDHGRHLGSITVECSDPETVLKWVRALRGGVR